LKNEKRRANEFNRKLIEKTKQKKNVHMKIFMHLPKQFNQRQLIRLNSLIKIVIKKNDLIFKK
jgi:hypothetical protein